MKITLSFLLLFALAACVTSKQGTVGYLVPGGGLAAAHKEVRACGSLGAYTFLLDDMMLEQALMKTGSDKPSEKASDKEANPKEAGPKQADVEFIVRLDFPSCYILRTNAEAAK